MKVYEEFPRGKPAGPFRRNAALSVAALVLLYFAHSHIISAADLRGLVIAVRDGDTVEVLVEGDMVVRVRLDGVDCPEQEQAFAEDAKRFTSDMVLRRDVTVVQKDKDDYGRVVGRVMIDGRDVSVELVKAGLAWHYKFYSEDPLLAELEKQARAAGLGLWSSPNPLPPWEYRRELPEKRLAPGQVYHGNVRSLVFHHPDCPQYNCRNCTRAFKSREDAIKAGYRPCGICKP